MTEGDTQTAPDTGTAAAAASDATQMQTNADGSGTDDQQNQQQDGGDQQNAQQDGTQQPPPLSQDEIIRQAEERAFQRMASWQGRRDKDLFDNLGNLIDSKIKQATPQQQPTPVDPATFLENPEAYLQKAVPKILQAEVSKVTQAEQTFNTELIRNAASRMDSDPLFADKELGNAVVQEIQKNFNSISRRLPPDVAAQLLVSDAVANVMRQRAATKTNPLAGNRPSGMPIGTIKAPPAPTPKVKPVKLSESAAALAKRWNYSTEDIAKVFGEQ